MIYGPCDFVPPITVTIEILERRRAIPLDKTEDINVRDIKTGRVSAVTGEVYVETLWMKK